MANNLIGVSIKGMRELEQRLGKLKPPAHIYQVGAMQVAKAIKDELMKYPPVNRPTRKSVYGQTWKSAKQRKWFFAALKKGEIKVPYKRTGTLRRGWAIDEFGADDAIVYNEVSYAKYVQEEASQSKYMSAVPWKTQESIVDRLGRDKAGRIMARAVEKELRK